jgi:hypothetical protein
MMLIGVDYHPSFQQMAFFEEETGESSEQQLNHSEGGRQNRSWPSLQNRRPTVLGSRAPASLLEDSLELSTSPVH